MSALSHIELDTAWIKLTFIDLIKQIAHTKNPLFAFEQSTSAALDDRAYANDMLPIFN